MTEALVALGSNMPSDQGDPVATLAWALAQIGAHPGLSLVRRSRWFRTPAYPAGAGPDFVNGAAVFATDLEPTEVLAVLHKTEALLGRTRVQRWEPRICDLDLLCHGDRIAPDLQTARRWIETDSTSAARNAPDELILPHPRLHERGFVLVPLIEVAPDWVHPVLGRNIKEMMADLPHSDLDAIRPL